MGKEYQLNKAHSVEELVSKDAEIPSVCPGLDMSSLF